MCYYTIKSKGEVRREWFAGLAWPISQMFQGLAQYELRVAATLIIELFRLFIETVHNITIL